MAEINNIGDLKGNFDEITDLLNSIRAQGMLGNAGMDKILNNINTKLEELSDDDGVALMRASLTELRNSVESRHNLLVAKISEIENSFSELVNRNSDNLKSSEIKELFDIIATNLSVFSKEVISQKDTLTEITLRIEALRADDTQKKDILRNISVLKVDIEKLNNGFESIVLNVNESFKDVAQTLDRIDTTKEIQNVKKDIENIYLSSNALLSAIQVVDQKNEAIEQLLNTLVTRETFQSAQDKLELIIDKSDDLRKDIGFLASKNEMNDLTQKIDTSIGVIAGLKTVLANANEESSKHILAQLNALDETVQHILSEDDFIRFRNELNALVKEVTQSTNLMRGDLLETNSEIRNVISLLNSLDIKTNFQELLNTVNNSETTVKNTISDVANRITQAQELSTNRTISDINGNIKSLNDKMSDFEINVKNSAAQNLSQILNTVNEVSATISALGNDLHNDNLGNISILDEKIHGLREQIDNVKSSLSGLNSENSDKILENISGMYSKIDNLKYELQQGNESNLGNITSTVNELSSYITSIFSQIKDSTENEVGKISGFVSDLSSRIDGMNAQISLATRESANDIKGGLSELSEKLENVFGSVDRASQETISSIISNIENVNDKLEYVKNDIQGDISYKVDSLRDVVNSVPQILNDSNLALERIVRENSDLSGLYDKISQISNDIYNNFEKFENDLRRDYRENLDKLFSDIEQLNQKLDNLNNDVNASNQNSVYAIKNNLAELTNKLDGIYSSLDNHSQDMIASIVANISDINSKVSLANSDLRNELVYKLSNFESIVESLPNSLKNAQSAVGQEYYDKTSYSINEILSNMKEVSSDLQFKFEKIENELKQSAEESADRFIHNFNSVTERLEYINKTIDETNQNSVQEIKNNLENLNQKLINISEILEGNSRNTVSEVVANISQLLNQLDYSTVKNELYASTTTIKTEIDHLAQVIRDTQDSSDSERREIVSQNAQYITELLNNIKVLSTNIDVNDSALKEKLESEILSIRELLVEFSETTRDLTANLRSDITDSLSVKISNLETIVARVAGNYDVSLFNMQEQIIEYLESMKLISESTDVKLTSSATEIKDVKDEIKSIFDELKTTTQANSSTFLDIYNTTADNFNELISKMSVVEELANREFPDVLTTGEFEQKIETISNIFDEYKAKLDDLNDKQELTLLAERLFAVKNQLDLISTDIIDVVSEKSEKLSIELVPIKEAVNQIVNYNLPTSISSVKEQIEMANNDLKALLKENSDEKSQNIINSVISGFDSFAEKINSLEFGLNTARNSGLNELKAILSGIVDTIANINAQVNIKHVDKSDLVIERIGNIEMVVQDGTLQNNDAIRTSVSEIVEKIDECININNEKSSKILELLSSTNTIQTKLTELSGDLGLVSGSIAAISDEIHVNNENAIQKFDLLNSTIIENSGTLQQEISRTCNKIDELETNIENSRFSVTSEIARVGENVSEVQQSVASRINDLELNIENGRQSIKDEISTAVNQINDTNAKLGTFDANISGLQQTFNSRIDELEGKIQNHSISTTSEIARVGENVSEVQQSVVSRINDLELNIENGRQSIKDEISTTVSQINDINNLTKTKLNEFGEKFESIESNSNLVSIEVNQSNQRLTMIADKIENIEHNLELNSQDIKSDIKAHILPVLEKYTDFATNEKLTEVAEIVESVSSKMLEVDYTIKEQCIEQLNSVKSRVEEVIEKLYSNKNELIENNNNRFEYIQGEICHALMKFDEVTSEISNINALNSQLIKSEFATIFGEFKQITEKLELPDNADYIVECLIPKFKDMEAGMIEVYTKGINECQENFNNIIEKLDSKSFEQTTKVLLEDLNHIFLTKIEDSTQELKDFVNAVADRSNNDINFEDFKSDLMGMFYDYEQKLDRQKSELEEIFAQEPDNSKIDELPQIISNNLNDLFDEYHQKIVDLVENSKNSSDIIEQSENLLQTFENIKLDLSDKIFENNEELRISIKNQQELFENLRVEFVQKVEEINSLYQENISSLSEKIEQSVLPMSNDLDKVVDSLNSISYEIVTAKTELVAKIASLASALDTIDMELFHEDFELINQKLDLLATNDPGISDLEMDIAEIKHLILQQNQNLDPKDIINSFVGKLDSLGNLANLEELNKLAELEEIVVSQKEIRELVVSFDKKLENYQNTELDKISNIIKNDIDELKSAVMAATWENSGVTVKDLSEIKELVCDKTEEIAENIVAQNDILNTLKSDVVTTVVKAVNEVNFDAEAEEIIEVIEDVEKSINSTIKESITSVVNTTVSAVGEISFEDEKEEIIDAVEQSANDVKNFVQDVLSGSITVNSTDSSVASTIEELKKENKKNSDNAINTMVSVFNQLSFADEAQDVIDAVDERADEIIDIVKDSQIALEDKIVSNYKEHSANIQNIADLINKSGNSNSLDKIKEELIDVRKNLIELRTGEEDSDYSYTLHDIETDIAKLRLVLNDMQKTINSAELTELNKSVNSIADAVEHIKMEMPSAEVFEIRSDIEKMTEDITSISVRTNKLILNSDETTNDVKDSLRQFRSVIEILEDRAKHLDSNRLTANLERKVDYLNNLAVSGAQSNKVMNQSFLYLAEWIDSAGAKIEDISETLEELKSSRPDDSAVLDMLGKKFEDQQNRINSLEEKLEQLLDAMDSRDNLQMTKKITNIDKQLTKLNKSIERLTSYVDEE